MPPPIPSPETDGLRERLREGLHLVAQALGASGVVSPLGLFELVSQLAEPAAVRRPGLRVEQGTGSPGRRGRLEVSASSEPANARSRTWTSRAGYRMRWAR